MPEMKESEKKTLLTDSLGPNSADTSYMGSYSATDSPYADSAFVDSADSYPYENYLQPHTRKLTDFSLGRRKRHLSEVDEGIDLCWKGIKVSAVIEKNGGGCCGCLKRNKSPPQVKQILKNVNGFVRAGSLLVIMGASGSGKTTLLNVLTQRNLGQLSVEGQILANGRPLGKNINSLAGYIQQDDLLVGGLTVREHLWFNAVLRMGRGVSDERRNIRIEQVMKEMGLKKCESTLIGIPGVTKGISGGEKKRLAFAAELLTKPAILFCDEPTSGLDSFMAKNVVESLKSLTQRGHTVLCTIHQPSSEVFALFDDILLMAEGRVAFMGPTSQLEGFFADHGYMCPQNYNPADFFIMSLAIVPGKEKECRDTVQFVCDSYDDSSFSRSVNYNIAEQEAMGKDKFIVEMDKVGTDMSLEKSDINENKKEKIESSEKYRSSWWTQFGMCAWRAGMDARRNKRALPTRVAQMVVSALFVGILWFQQPNTMTGVANIDGVMFCFLVQCTFNTAFVIATSFSREFSIFIKEHQDRQYSVGAYYFGKVVIDIPFVCLASMCYIVVVYWMVGLTPTATCFFIAVAVVLLLTITAGSYGHLASAIFPNPTMALTLLPFILGLTLLCSGCLIKQNSIPDIFKPIAWVSSYKYGYEILVINQWRSVTSIDCEFTDQAQSIHAAMNRTKPGSAPVASNWCYPNGDAVIYSYEFSLGDMPYCFVIMIAIAIGVQTIAYLSFRYKTSKR